MTEQQLRGVADTGVRVSFRNGYMHDPVEGLLVTHGRHLCVIVVRTKSKIPGVIREHRYYRVDKPDHILRLLDAEVSNDEIWLIVYLLDKNTPDRPYNKDTAQHFASWDRDTPLEVDRSLQMKVADILCAVYTRQQVTTDARQRSGDKGRRRYLGSMAERRRLLNERFGVDCVEAVLGEFSGGGE